MLYYDRYAPRRAGRDERNDSGGGGNDGATMLMSILPLLLEAPKDVAEDTALTGVFTAINKAPLLTGDTAGVINEWNAFKVAKQTEVPANKAQIAARKTTRLISALAPMMSGNGGGNNAMMPVLLVLAMSGGGLSL